MPYEPTDPAAWWHGAEAMPPKPDEPACDAPGAGPSSMPPVVGSRSFTNIPNAPAWVPPAPPPELRVGDRLLGDDGVVSTVDYLPDSRWINAVTAGGGRHGIPAGCVGPPGSGKPWTLLPREVVPHTVTTLPVSMGHIPGPPNDIDVAAMRAEGRRALDRMKAEYARPDGGGAGGSMVHDVPPAPVAAVRTLERIGYTWHGGTEWKPPLGPAPDFARLDAERARRDALERLAEAAKAWFGDPDIRHHRGMRSAVDDLAALDGDGGA